MREPVAGGERHRLHRRQLVAIGRERQLGQHLGFAGRAFEQIGRPIAAVRADGERHPPALPVLAQDAQCAALAGEVGREIGLQEGVVEAPLLETRPRPDVAKPAVLEHAAAVDIDGRMLVEQVLAAVAQVDPHQRDAISAAVRQRPGIARVDRIAEDANVIPVGAADYLAPAADAVGDVGAPAAVRQAMDPHAQSADPRHRPAADAAGVLGEQRHLPGGQVQPVEIEHRSGAAGVTDDDRVGIIVDRAHEFDPHAVERGQIAGNGRRRLDVHGEEMGVLVAVAVHQEQQALAIPAPPKTVAAGPGGARLARRLDSTCRGLVEAPEMQGRAALAHRDPGQPGAVGRHPIVPTRARIGEQGGQGQERRLVRRAGAGRGEQDRRDQGQQQHVAQIVDASEAPSATMRRRHPGGTGMNPALL